MTAVDPIERMRGETVPLARRREARLGVERPQAQLIVLVARVPHVIAATVVGVVVRRVVRRQPRVMRVLAYTVGQTGAGTIRTDFLFFRSQHNFDFSYHTTPNNAKACF